MTELVSGSASIADLYERISFYKSSPPRVVQAVFDYLDDVMNNKIDLVDPTNPFIMLIESSAVLTSLAINESLLNLRRSYVGLSETDRDVYRHMTDSEFSGRFSTPGKAVFTLMFDLTSLVNHMVQDLTENCLKAIIPRDSYITVDSYVFTLEYPIVIRRFSNQVTQITHDTSTSSPISQPSNNIIAFKARQDTNGKKWLYFTIPLKQMKISTVNYAVQRESIFSKDIAFDDQYLYARVFQKSGTNPNWVEMYTTHSDQVFDHGTLTSVLQVTTNNLNVTIPFIYNTLGMASGQIRVDVYTTKGEIDVNLGSYTGSSFQVKLRNIDSIRDDNPYTGIWGNVNFFGFSDQILSGGTNGISFEHLKEKVTNRAFGHFNLPITTAQLDTVGEYNGFIIVRNADSLTNRYLLGVKAIPDISIKDTTTNAQKFLSRANVGMIRFSSDIPELEASDNVANNHGRLTILSNTSFLLENGKASIVESLAISAIKAKAIGDLVNTVNDAVYVYTPYYYVLDLQESFLNVRPYDLDHPDIANLSFVLQNITLMLVVNTASYAIEKVDFGYKMTIVTVSGTLYQDLNDNQVGVQLRLRNEDDTLFGTINGIQQESAPDTKERIYTFDIHTTYDINDQHSIEVTNAYGSNGLISRFYVPLNSVVDILYTTTSKTVSFIPDETDELINKAQLPLDSVGNSHDTVELFLGQYLEHLWARTRTYATGNRYQVSPVDVPAIYETDVYEINPVTGSMLFIEDGEEPHYNKLHSLGDPVLDEDDQPTYQYRAGDNILDNEGNPIIVDAVGSKNDLDILVIDGKFLFVTDPNYLTYRDRVSTIMTDWITTDILEIQKRLIERTEIFFYPQASLGVTQIVVGDNRKVYINSEQKLTVTIFVDRSVISDVAVQTSISDTVAKYLDYAISQLKFTVNQVETNLRLLCGSNVHGVTISGLGGEVNYKSMTVTDQHNRLCVKRKLLPNTDNSITIVPDINIIFMQF